MAELDEGTFPETVVTWFWSPQNWVALNREWGKKAKMGEFFIWIHWILVFGPKHGQRFLIFLGWFLMLWGFCCKIVKLVLSEINIGYELLWVAMWKWCGRTFAIFANRFWGTVWKLRVCLEGTRFQNMFSGVPRLHCTGHKAHKQSYAYRYDHCTLTVWPDTMLDYVWCWILVASNNIIPTSPKW